MADDLTIHAKTLAENKASNSAMTAVVGGMIGVLEAHNSSIVGEMSEMLAFIKQRVIITRDNAEQPQDKIVQYFIDCYLKKLDDIQVQRDTSRTRTENRLREKPEPEA